MEGKFLRPPPGPQTGSHDGRGCSPNLAEPAKTARGVEVSVSLNPLMFNQSMNQT